MLTERFASDLCFILDWASGLRQVGQSDALPSLYNYHMSSTPVYFLLYCMLWVLCLPACISVYHEHSWCSRRLEEGVRFSATGVKGEL